MSWVLVHSAVENGWEKMIQIFAQAQLRPLGIVNVIIVYCQHSSVTSASANLQNTIGMPTENNPKIEAKRPRSSQDIQEYAKSWELRTSGGPE